VVDVHANKAIAADRLQRRLIFVVRLPWDLPTTLLK